MHSYRLFLFSYNFLQKLREETKTICSLGYQCFKHNIFQIFLTATCNNLEYSELELLRG